MLVRCSVCTCHALFNWVPLDEHEFLKIFSSVKLLEDRFLEEEDSRQLKGVAVLKRVDQVLKWGCGE